MANVFYEQANAAGVTQTTGHKAFKVSAPKSRKRGRDPVSLQGSK